jgi:O-antigen ligase
MTTAKAPIAWSHHPNVKELLFCSFILITGVLTILWPFQYVLGIFFILGYVIGALLYPSWPIYLLIIVTPLTRVPRINQYVDLVFFFLSFLTIFSWFVRLKTSSDKRKWGFLLYKEFHLFIFLFIFLIFLSSMASVNITSSMQLVPVYAFIFLFLYYFLDVLRNESCLKKSLFLFLFVSVMIALIAILQALIMRFHVLTGLQGLIIPFSQRVSLFSNMSGGAVNGDYRSIGTFYNSNNLSAYLALSVPILVSLQFCIKGFVKRCFMCCALAIVLMGMYCSGSRGGLINILSSSLFLLVLYWNTIPKKLKIYGILTGGFFLYVSQAYIFRFLRLSEGVSYRDIIWANTIQLIKEHPLVGHGLGTFSQEFFSRFGFPSMSDLQDILTVNYDTGDKNFFPFLHAHNLFLNYAYEIGIFGVLVMFLFYFNYMRTFVRFFAHHQQGHSFNFAVVMGCTGALIGQFIHNFLDSFGLSFYHSSYSLILLVSIGIILMHKSIGPSNLLISQGGYEQ